eukprot:scaffold50979_cov61-Phaeocystis_antarctica.AAC.5
MRLHRRRRRLERPRLRRLLPASLPRGVVAAAHVAQRLAAVLLHFRHMQMRPHRCCNRLERPQLCCSLLAARRPAQDC